MESNPTDGSLLVTCGGSINISSSGGYECKTRLYKLPDDVLSSAPPQATQTTSSSSYNNTAAAAGYYNTNTTTTREQRMVTPSQPDDDNNNNNNNNNNIHEEALLETLLTLQHDTPSRLSAILWKPIADAYSDYTTAKTSTALSNEVCTVGPEGLRIFDTTGHGDGVCTTHVAMDMNTNTNTATAIAGSWDPHNIHLIGAAYGQSVGIWDVRVRNNNNNNAAPVQSISNAHRHGICDLDYNPNRPYILCTGGEDGLIKFWDLRKAGTGTQSQQQEQEPIKILSGHTHWANTVKYNRFHDQLLLSGSTDSTVNLWRVSSISSAPYMELEEEKGLFMDHHDYHGGDGDGDASDCAVDHDHNGDMRINRFEHQESVYSVAWSACDAWLFASLSYDGNVVVNCVPSKEKYKILL